MPGLDKFGRPVGYGDGRDPSLADKVRLLQQLVKERQKADKGKSGKKPGLPPSVLGPIASINRPNRGGQAGDWVRRPVPDGWVPRPRRNQTGGLMAPVDPSRMPREPIYPGPPLPNGKRYR